MKNRFNDSQYKMTTTSFSINDSRSARLYEMHRRLKSLQAKRLNLRNQLDAVEKYLVSLDSQIKSFEMHEHIGFNSRS